MIASDYTEFLIAAVAMFVVGSVWMFVTLHYRERRKRDAINREPLISPEVREATHKLANEATKLRASARRSADSPNPIAELVASLEAAHDRHTSRGRS